MYGDEGEVVFEGDGGGPVGLRHALVTTFGASLNAVRSDPKREVVWVGTSGGDVATLTLKGA